jgi:hypothetical protein
MYPVINSIHFDKPLDKLGPKEADAHFQWFLSVIPERIKILEEEIQKGTKSFSATFDCRSLLDVGNWLKNSAMYMEVSIEDRQAIIKRDNLKGLPAQLTWEMSKTLTLETRYMCFDVSIYFGETLRREVPDLIWKMEKRKSLHDYHRPILDKEKNRPAKCLPLNSIVVIKTITNKLLEGSMPDILLDSYNYWYKNFTTGRDALKV